jgi:hypothetical protein
MGRVALIVCFFVISLAGAAYGQQQQQPRFTTCSQVAEFSKQQCASTYRPVICQNTVEQNRTSCPRPELGKKARFQVVREGNRSPTCEGNSQTSSNPVVALRRPA